MQSIFGPLSPSQIAPGAILAGKYRIERTLGEGGMGVVLAAQHVALDQRVALKVLRVASVDRPDIVERFVREARNAVRLRSQHVARVLDVGTLDGGVPFIVLEYLEGADLDAVLREHGPMPYARAIALTLQACEAVAEAHALGIIHRDIKPHNLFLTTGIGGGDLLKVLDFGIAKSGSLGTGGGVLTRSDSSVGSPLYMSPEQMRSPRDVDSRTDIWSLGVTLYELIAGQPPFDAESFPELVLKVQEGHIVPLSTVRPDVPPGLADAIARCLRRDPEERFPHVAALASALEPFTWPEARASAENARRALGMSPSTPGVPVAPPPGSQVPPVPPTSRSQDHVSSSPGSAPPPNAAARSGSSGPNAWTESVARTGSIPPRTTKIALAGALAVGLAVILSVAAVGTILVRRYVLTPSQATPLPTASASEVALPPSTPPSIPTSTSQPGPSPSLSPIVPDPSATAAPSAKVVSRKPRAVPSNSAAPKPPERGSSLLDGVPAER